MIYALDRYLHDREHVDGSTIWYDLDLTDEDKVTDFGLQLNEKNTKLDLVVHSAGVRGLTPSMKLTSQIDIKRAEDLTVTSADVSTIGCPSIEHGYQCTRN